ncbi:MAG: ABC transporter ATP-binding protein [Geobacteraceae bacterium]|nr:ABC transporter ATP-binding protein [Geobacteraceae bacterium]
MSAISIHGLSKTFRGKRGARVVALKNLDLEIEQGEIFGFLGPNGAGKSTTIKTLMGLIRPTSGSALIMGKDISSPDARRHVGFLPENPAFYEYLSAAEYLNFVGRTFSMDASQLEKKSEEVLKLLDLWDARKRLLRSYSKGMVQRVGLAQVLLHNPDVYILDEPMSGLDPIGRSLVKDIILDLKGRGKSVFFSTHITSDVESVCDRVGVIVKGEMKCVRRVDEIAVGGITGYEVRHVTAGSTTPEVIQVTKESLSAKLSELQASGSQVLVVEPLRKNLEEFFVDIVRQE